MTTKLIPMALQALTRDGWLLFLTRFARLFAYGSLSVILVFYLVGLGLTEAQSGLVLTLTLAGDVVVSLLLTTQADRIGRRRMLVIGATLMAAAGLAFAFTRNLFFLIVAGTIGVISPSGNEVGPFLSIEQAALSHIVPSADRTEVFAWYTLAGSLATALGALCGGLDRLCNGPPSLRLRATVQWFFFTRLWGYCWRFSSRGYPHWWRWVRFRSARSHQRASHMFLE
jgi:MFS family permease